MDWKKTIGRLWQAVTTHKIWALAIFPFVARPAHFDGAGGRPAFARRRWGLFALPVAAAGLWAHANSQMARFMLELNFDRLSQSLGPAEAYRRSLQLQGPVAPLTTALVVVGILLIASARHAYHGGVRRCLSRFVTGLQPIRWKFFLMSTASAALWLGGLAVVSVWGLKLAQGGRLADAMEGKDALVLAALVGLAVLQHVSHGNREVGFRAAYGGSRLLLLGVDLLALGGLVGLLLLLGRGWA